MSSSSALPSAASQLSASSPGAATSRSLSSTSRATLSTRPGCRPPHAQFHAPSRLFRYPPSEASICLAQALRCFVKPSFLSELTCKLPSSRNEVGARPCPVLTLPPQEKNRIPCARLAVADRSHDRSHRKGRSGAERRGRGRAGQLRLPDPGRRLSGLLKRPLGAQALCVAPWALLSSRGRRRRDLAAFTTQARRTPTRSSQPSRSRR